MPNYSHPGVYIEEISSGSKPIEGVGTSTAAFIGEPPRGPVNQAVLIHSWDDYVAQFGDISSESDAMGFAVQAFYLNGGRDAYIARISNSTTSEKLIAGVGESVGNVLRLAASSPGAWGEDIYVKITNDSVKPTEFSLEIGHRKDGLFVRDEFFEKLTMIDASPDYVLKRVNGASKFITAELVGNAKPAADPNAYVKGSLTGDGLTELDTAFTDSVISDNMEISLNIDGMGPKTINLGPKKALELSGNNTEDGGKVATAIQNQVRKNCGPQAAYQNFTCTYAANRKFVLTSGTASPSSSVVVYAGPDASKLKLTGSWTVSVHGTSAVMPTATTAIQGEPLAGGSDSLATASDYQSFFGDKLRKVRDASILLLPGKSYDSAGKPFISAALSHCETMGNRMLILDVPAGSVLDQATTVEAFGLPSSTYSVLYYPWVKVANPAYHAEKNPTAAKIVPVAPSAFAAGMWAKTDGKRGVWKAPAGMETNLLGVAELMDLIEDGDQDQLNPLGVNCLRKMPGAGPVIWGSRTLATKADPEWRYVSVRRTAIMIEQSIYNGIQWAVFEPNDHRLWSALRGNIGGFMNSLFRVGAFQGEKASDAYFVRCGLGDTMTQAEIDAGQVIVIVGFAPLKPAEFVIVRIQQKVNQQ